MKQYVVPAVLLALMMSTPALSQGGKKKGGPFGYDTNDVDPKIKTRLSAQEQKKHFIVPRDFEIELVAADPVVINPITMILDDKGRIIVSESHTYRYGPKGSPIKPFANPVVRLDPDGKGGFKRTLVADGFDDPVMGIAVKGNKLWLTANNYLYTYDLPAEGEAKGDKGKDARRPLDEKQKELLKKSLAVAANWRLETDPRLKAVGSIELLDHPDAVDALFTLLRGQTDDVTVIVAGILADTGSPKALAAVANLGSVDSELGQHDRQRFRNPSITEFTHYHAAFIRHWASEQLKAKAKQKHAPAESEPKGDKEVRPPLNQKQQALLKEWLAVASRRGDLDSRLEAVEKIRSLNHPDAVDALLTLLPGDRDQFTVHVARTLSFSRSPKALAALAALRTPPPVPRTVPVIGVGVDRLASRELAVISHWAEEQIKAIQKEPQKSAGIAINKKAIVTDLNKAWNPFGMFVLEWGPDGKLYMSVGNHAINLQGPNKDKMSGRGSSGIVVRMNPDGTGMERLVHGLRVPYSFEYDPFGQLWLLSNGEGNPNRLVRVIEAVDYHCYSRPGVDNSWLAGNHPLAPPCEELHRGAHTQLMRYYAAAYPAEYQGNLFLCNWGAHGFAGPNRGIFRFVTNDRNNIVKREPLVHCRDPHFRPAHICLDVDGSLLIADWYGRDDESDMTGRIWRLKYVGKDRPVVKHKLDSHEWKNDAYAIEALGSPSHLIREKAINELVMRKQCLEKLSGAIRGFKEPIGAANAMWVLTQMYLRHREDRFIMGLFGGAAHPDWRVRRLAAQLMLRYENINEPVPAVFLGDPVKAVWLTGALRQPGSDAILRAIRDLALTGGDLGDPHVRYEAAWHLAKHADEQKLSWFIASDNADIRLAGLIAIDVACYENFPSKKAALAALAKGLENPGKLDHQLLLTLAQFHGDASIVPSLEKLIARDDLPTATIAKAVMVLKAKGGALSSKLGAQASKRVVEAIEKGQLKVTTPAEMLVIFEFLESEGPTPFALSMIEMNLRSTQAQVKQAAHALARRFGTRADPLAGKLWPRVLDPKTKFEETIETLSTVARVQDLKRAVDSQYFLNAGKNPWVDLLDHQDPHVRTEAVRWWRSFKDYPSYGDFLAKRATALIQKDEKIKDDLATVLRHLDVKPEIIESLSLPAPEKDKSVLAKYAVDELAKLPAAERSKRAAMGQQVFERSACTKCHTTATATTPLAPSLKGIGQQKTDYLIESVLHPSKVIKTGWEVEQIETKDGKVVTGLVKDDGKTLRVIQAMDYLKPPLMLDKANVETRTISKISLMPEGQEATLSRREFADLIAYLATLK